MRKKIMTFVLVVLLLTALTVLFVGTVSAGAGGCPPAAAVGAAEINTGNAATTGANAAEISAEKQGLPIEDGGLGHAAHGDNSAHGFDKQQARCQP